MSRRSATIRITVDVPCSFLEGGRGLQDNEANRLWTVRDHVLEALEARKLFLRTIRRPYAYFKLRDARVRVVDIHERPQRA